MKQRTEHLMLVDDPLWYKDAIIYELHVRAFADSNDDGIGDFCGLTNKLDYLQDLGVTAIWLLPFYPSPLQDDGYDIADYTDVHPAYGSLRDFKAFLKAAHKRGLKVITELVLNHTSSQHPWFQRARRAKPGSIWRDFYVWSDTPERYRDARIIFQDFEGSNWSWDAVANAYYWHRFYSHQPDLNFENPHVRTAILKVVDFWLRLGVDGLRLDAVPYLFEREGTTGENLPETHDALRRLRRHIDDNFPARMLLAEANQWPEDAVAYFGQGDECHMAFHFPLMPRLFMSVRMEDRFPILDILAQTPPIPETAQWALFLRNHDELTLEMVTDAERVYMYRTYARDEGARINLGIRRRLAPLLHNNRRKIELLNGLLFSLPGTPVIYYGDEIGMGDNIYLGDRNGVRTPMQWSVDRNAGFSRANAQQLYLPLIVDYEYHHETIHVEAQQRNPSSLLNWTKRLIGLRKRYRAFGRGTIEFLHPQNRKVLAFIRHDGDEQILVVANLSRFLQHVQLDLAGFSGCEPVELFGRSAFPPIDEQPYALTLAPHAFYWFSLERQPSEPNGGAEQPAIPVLTIDGSWEDLICGRSRAALEDALPTYLRASNWFIGRRRTILATSIRERVAIPAGEGIAYLLIIRVQYADDEPEVYLVPVTSASGAEARRLEGEHPEAIIARLCDQHGDELGLLYDAMWSTAFATALLEAIRRRRHFHGIVGKASAWPLPELRGRSGLEASRLPIGTLQARHNNTAIVYGDQLILKLIRCVDEGIHPELELGAFLTKRQLASTPSVLGAISYGQHEGDPATLAILQAFVPNQGELWDTTLTQVRRYLARADSAAELDDDGALTAAALLDLADQEAPHARKLIGGYLDRAQQLGQRTAELHLALSTDVDEADFAPHPFTMLYQRSLYQSMRSLVGLVFDDLRRHLASLPAAVQADVRALFDDQQQILQRFKAVTAAKIDVVRIRCHGDYHLGQILDTGDDVVIFDFEGEVGRSVLERRLTRPVFEDLASMLRSLYAATYAARLEHARDQSDGRQPDAALEPQARLWARHVSAAFLRGYLTTAADAPFVPQDRADRELLLDIFLIARIVAHLDVDLREQPERLPFTIGHLRDVLGANDRAPS